ncbi:MAG: hypothetical protein FWC80_04135 [Firmicutes bacterium]|nr:hypothetical protein [Bacillota bacterium]
MSNNNNKKSGGSRCCCIGCAVLLLVVVLLGVAVTLVVMFAPLQIDVPFEAPETRLEDSVFAWDDADAIFGDDAPGWVRVRYEVRIRNLAGDERIVMVEGANYLTLIYYNQVQDDYELAVRALIGFRNFAFRTEWSSDIIVGYDLSYGTNQLLA